VFIEKISPHEAFSFYEKKEGISSKEFFSFSWEDGKTSSLAYILSHAKIQKKIKQSTDISFI